MRGLKLGSDIGNPLTLGSHLTQVRGLKLDKYAVVNKTPFAPHAGAWIETIPHQYQYRNRTFAPHAGAWIETNTSSLGLVVLPFAPHAGAWIETKGVCVD